MVAEQPFVFECKGQRLLGIVHAAGADRIGVMVIVGGPQYRVGSHRQFVLFARFLAEHGVPVMRFDYRGMGDSEGDARNYDDINDDIRAAIDAFMLRSPGLTSVMLWGLCDAATAATFYAHTDPRVKAVMLLNPWVHTERGEARTYLKYYYVRRLFNAEFWQKLMSGRLELRKSVLSLMQMIRLARGDDSATPSQDVSYQDRLQWMSLPDRMYHTMKQFDGAISIIISGDDLTAAEFQDMVKSSRLWRKLIKEQNVEYHHVAEANHTFSSETWRDEVAQYSLNWLKKISLSI